MANTVTIPKTEYKRLKQIAQRFEAIRGAIAPQLFPEFPSESIKEYTHPQRIRHSLKNAFEKYPIAR